METAYLQGDSFLFILHFKGEKTALEMVSHLAQRQSQQGWNWHFIPKPALRPESGSRPISLLAALLCAGMVCLRKVSDASPILGHDLYSRLHENLETCISDSQVMSG